MTGETGPEWPSTLDVPALLAQGWRPTPFREFVLKIHSRCDLACDYCYMYEMADQSWRSQPLRMSRGVIDQTAARIAEHARAHRLSVIKVILHGGEPLLAGPRLISHAVAAVRGAAPADTRVDISIQTNAVGLDMAYLRLFDELNVRIGVSLDGDAAGHDRHRRRATGRGSYAQVSEALGRLASGRFRHLFSGLLCTVDIRNDPVATYQELLAYRPAMVDFLLPHGNWAAPPPGRQPGAADTPYASWLTAVFDRWYGSPRRTTRVRLFDEIIHLLLGGPSATEAVGLSPVALLVIETDGSIEGGDALKSAYPGAPATALHVARHSLDQALLLPSLAARQIGMLALADECRSCAVRQVCGGGHYAHRYRSGTGFANPSVYSPDLFRLITYIRGAVESDIDDRLARRR
ncbi:MAG TPA: FxsB family cyclophane-forming radical SAM/SPASM peptide maturase [Streptosporangiaceae bacterium]|nr:FxsB family cyclophane-forming radical SAM/SPASM peptide maturase [Streptosporangiaceae bacterium]